MIDSPEQRKMAMVAAWQSLRQRCISDVNVFIEHIFRDDQTPGSPAFKQQWFHQEWQSAWQSQRISVIHGAVGHGKTEQAIGHLLWRIGKNPHIRILIVGKSDDKAKELLAKIKRQIEQNETLRAIFPELRPGDTWGAETLRVAGAGIDTTTNTVTTYGITNPKAGPRADIVLLDDINDIENTRNADRREHVISTVDSVIQTRFTTDGQMMVLANAWHPDDFAFTYSRRPGVWHGVYPALSTGGDVLWPSFRPLAWLRRAQETMSPTEFSRMYLCQPRDEQTRIFKQAWFDMARGMGTHIKPTYSVEHMFDRDGRPSHPDFILSPARAYERQMRVIVGVDLASGKTERKRKTDFTVLFVLGLRSDGRRQVLWIERGRWDAGETIGRMRDIEDRYRPELFVVEDNGGQHFLISHARSVLPYARIEPVTTTADKWDPSSGVESIGIELQSAQWVIPSYCGQMTAQEQEASKEISLWESHLLDFSRTGHTPDVVMACYFAQRRASSIDTKIFAPSVFNTAPTNDPFAAQFPPVAESKSQEIEIPPHYRAMFNIQLWILPNS